MNREVTTSPNLLRSRARHLKLMVFDVDGVMTDGRLYYGPEGELFKIFNTQDGHGMKQLRAAGVNLAIITGRDSRMVSTRAGELGIAHVIQGRADKREALMELAGKLELAAEHIGYAGDDEPDEGALQWCGLAFSVANGHAGARAVADLVTQRSGGDGAVREICDFILDARPAAAEDRAS